MLVEIVIGGCLFVKTLNEIKIEDHKIPDVPMEHFDSRTYFGMPTVVSTTSSSSYVCVPFS